MPHPKEGESKKEFISRCIPILIHEGRESDQAAAICYSLWERRNLKTTKIIKKVLTK
jgi:hypothetical protein